MYLRFLLVFLLLAGTAFCQTFTGTIDGYYGGNFNRPGVSLPGPDGVLRDDELRAFDFNHNSFSLNLAKFSIEQKAAPIGFRVDVGFGDAMKVINSGEPACQTARINPGSFDCSFYQHLEQAYVTAAKGKVTVDFGKFVTPAGAEVIETKDNWNYSRSFLFSWAIPFYHFGSRVTATPNDKLSLGAFISNGWNDVKDNNSGKTIGLFTTVKPKNWTVTMNYIFGDETCTANKISGCTTLPNVGGKVRHLWDATVMYDVNKTVSVMANYDYGMDHNFSLVGIPRTRWQGVATYAKIKASPKVTISPRYEWYNDYTGTTTGQQQVLQEVTFTAQFPVHDDLSLYAEYRHDWSDHTPFVGKNLFDQPIGKDTQDTMTLGVVYTFTKGGK
jgi:hypothetical protein